MEDSAQDHEQTPQVPPLPQLRAPPGVGTTDAARGRAQSLLRSLLGECSMQCCVGGQRFSQVCSSSQEGSKERGGARRGRRPAVPLLVGDAGAAAGLHQRDHHAVGRPQRRHLQAGGANAVEASLLPRTKCPRRPQSLLPSAARAARPLPRLHHAGSCCSPRALRWPASHAPIRAASLYSPTHPTPCRAASAAPLHPWWPPAPGSAPACPAGPPHQRPAPGSSLCCSRPRCGRNGRINT